MSGPFAALARTRKGKWAFWKFHWLANQGLVRALERARAHARGDLLDVGCGSRPFAWLFEGRVARYWGTDLRSSSYLAGRPPDAFASAEAQPIRSGSMDTVLGLSMMTYLPEPGRMLAEAHRVLKPGGTLILEFTQMVPLHDEPWDFFRFTRHGAAWLLERAGFEVVEAIPVGSLWARVGTTLTEPLNRINRGPTRVLTEIPVRLLYVLVHLVFGLLDRVAADPREVLAHVVVARRQG